jgi:hypothetical protein
MNDHTPTGPASTTNDIPLPRPGDPLLVLWYVPIEERAILWRRDGRTFEAPIVESKEDPKHPYREEVPLTAWSQARPSIRSGQQLDGMTTSQRPDPQRLSMLPQVGLPIMLLSDDHLVWKALDGIVYTTPRGRSPHYWDQPGAENGWVVTFREFEEIHPYDFDWPDHGPLLDQPL